jgi:hypothetical protein
VTWYPGDFEFQDVPVNLICPACGEVIPGSFTRINDATDAAEGHIHEKHYDEKES